MADDDADPALVELLRATLLGSQPTPRGLSSETNVLRDAEHIYNNSIDVAIDASGTKSAARAVWAEMQRRNYSASAWGEHELHPTSRDESTVRFIFTMDLLNFSFWSELEEGRRFAVRYGGRKWTGYWGLVACLRRAEEEGVRIADPAFWYRKKGEDGHADGRSLSNSVDTTMNEDHSEEEASAQQSANDVEEASKSSSLTMKVMEKVFRGEGDEPMPLLQERLQLLREAGRVLHEDFDGSVLNLLQAAEGSAGKLVNLLAKHFDCFRDEATFDGRKVRFLKRAQIFVADLWAAFEGTSFGTFTDIDCITMFADYRVPQQLHSLGCLVYSPSLDYAIRSLKIIEPGSSWECQLRGCSIWTVELIRRHILQEHPEAKVNAILIDFFLYDIAKEREKAGEESIPHHRTRSIWY